MPKLHVPKELMTIGQAIAQAGGNPVLVGGSVRNQLLGMRVDKDWDVEVFNLSLQTLKHTLTPFGRVHSVGRSFGVLKFMGNHHEYDFSVPRKERNMGKGHKGFWIDCDPDMDFFTAASRRDFTINAIGYAFLEGALLDPHQGQKHLTRRVLRHVGPAFSEDPLRVLRGLQFAGRFHFKIDPNTLAMCRQQDLSELPRERIWEEIRKLFLRSPQPSQGLRYMHTAGVLPYLPELQALYSGRSLQTNTTKTNHATCIPAFRTPAKYVQQAPCPAWRQALKAVDAMCAILRKGGLEKGETSQTPASTSPALLDEDTWVTLCLSALLEPMLANHPNTPKAKPTPLVHVESLLNRVTHQVNIKQWILELLAQWQSIQGFEQLDEAAAAACVRQLAQVRGCQHLAFLSAAIHQSKYPNTPAVGALRLETLAKQLGVWQKPLQPLLLGRHFLALGMSPGPKMGDCVRHALNAQIEGCFSTVKEAQAWLAQNPPWQSVKEAQHMARPKPPMAKR